MSKKGEAILAKSENINEIITDFIKDLKEFQTNVDVTLGEINNTVSTIEWTGTEATNFIKTVKDSTENIKEAVSESNNVIISLEKKAEEWVNIINQIKSKLGKQ